MMPNKVIDAPLRQNVFGNMSFICACRSTFRPIYLNMSKFKQVIVRPTFYLEIRVLFYTFGFFKT